MTRYCLGSGATIALFPAVFWVSFSCITAHHHEYRWTINPLHTVVQKAKGTWEAAKEATMEAEKQGAEAHLKSCEAEHLLQSASELTQAAANARAREEEVSRPDLCKSFLCTMTQSIL